mmetsp:Transcript_24115/g.37875  ORF Transcript_24115/g.37875 Transcript_24115/m.37875 type:complete len:653 (+) Transcript_24115:466-2424(+)|eukprot:CAMPEP_0184295674 /NCGR_PEP_ID=MMETSP1049-20130417/6537_1 /TAXON_ID=77928 /ORGANISM="Proteomonas sulcata, Strain CCMP704" /LENGTH=652 /DNA_ID=CAMNT_0026604353 /DNA_START=472 /DNA_END=2430 /DNA_ORIENTATION=+
MTDEIKVAALTWLSAYPSGLQVLKELQDKLQAKIDSLEKEIVEEKGRSDALKADMASQKASHQKELITQAESFEQQLEDMGKKVDQFQAAEHRAWYSKEVAERNEQVMQERLEEEMQRGQQAQDQAIQDAKNRVKAEQSQAVAKQAQHAAEEQRDLAMADAQRAQKNLEEALAARKKAEKDFANEAASRESAETASQRMKELKDEAEKRAEIAEQAKQSALDQKMRAEELLESIQQQSRRMEEDLQLAREQKLDAMGRVTELESLLQEAYAKAKQVQNDLQELEVQRAKETRYRQQLEEQLREESERENSLARQLVIVQEEVDKVSVALAEASRENEDRKNAEEMAESTRSQISVEKDRLDSLTRQLQEETEQRQVAEDGMKAEREARSHAENLASIYETKLNELAARLTEETERYNSLFRQLQEELDRRRLAEAGVGSQRTGNQRAESFESAVNMQIHHGEATQREEDELNPLSSDCSLHQDRPGKDRETRMRIEQEMRQLESKLVRASQARFSPKGTNPSFFLPTPSSGVVANGSPPSPKATPTEAGVGLLLGKFKSERHRADRIFILEVVPGGSAWESGMIEVNDMVHSVDGQEVAALRLDRVFNVVKGPLGSSVVLNMERPKSGELYVVTLERKLIPDHTNSPHLREV